MNIPNVVRREIDKLVPNSLQNNIIAFVFNNYKKKKKHSPEIIIATKHGEIIECSNKTIQRSIEIDDRLIEEISIYQSIRRCVYYIVSTASKLFVISTEKLHIVSFVDDLDRYEINDLMCTGTAYLQVWANGNAVPLVFDDNKNIFVDSGYIDKCVSQSNDRFTHEGRRNQNAMEYMVAENEETLRKVVAMRHMLGFMSNTNLQDDGCSSTSSDTFSGYEPKDWMKIVHRNKKDIDNNRAVFIIKEKKPWIKQYHTKTILGVEIQNHGTRNVCCHNVKMLLHHTTELSVPYPISYKTQMYVKDSLSPLCWKKKKDNTLLTGETATLICVVKNLDFEQSPSFIISSFLEYELAKKRILVSLNDVVVEGSDVVRELFEIYMKMNRLDELDLLAITGASEKTDLTVTVYNETLQSENFFTNSPTPLDMSQILHAVLGFSQIDVEENKTLLAHCSAPHNPLFGVFLDISKKETNENDLDVFKIITFTSCEKQIMTLVNLLYNAIPSRIVITTNGLEVSKVNMRPQQDQLSPIIGESRMEIDQDEPKLLKELQKVTKFGISMTNQMSLLLEYFDLCMQSMAKSKLHNVIEKIGTKIDILAPGKDDFNKFINAFDEEVVNGCDVLYNEEQ